MTVGDTEWGPGLEVFAEGVLWALEAKALNRFDGTTWERFESPFV